MILLPSRIHLESSSSEVRVFSQTIEVKCDIQNNSLIVVVVHLTLTASINEYHGPKPPLPNMNTIQLFEICLSRNMDSTGSLNAVETCRHNIHASARSFSFFRFSRIRIHISFGSERVRRVAILFDWPHELVLQSLRGGLKKRSRRGVWRKEGACASKRTSRGAIHFSTSTKNLTSFGALEKAHILSSVSWIEQISFRPIDIVLSDQKNPSLRPSIHQSARSFLESSTRTLLL